MLEKQPKISTTIIFIYSTMSLTWHLMEYQGKQTWCWHHYNYITSNVSVFLKCLLSFPFSLLLSHSSLSLPHPSVPDELSITLCGFIRSLSKLPALSVMQPAEGLFWRPPLCNWKRGQKDEWSHRQLHSRGKPWPNHVPALGFHNTKLMLARYITCQGGHRVSWDSLTENTVKYLF